MSWSKFTLNRNDNFYEGLTNDHMSTNTLTAGGDASQAEAFLTSFLNKNLHIHISDGRMFVGQMKCTDNERNIILAMTHEYRQPSQADIRLAAEKHEKSGESGNVKVDMKKRFVGLVVVPGWCIEKIEVEG